MPAPQTGINGPLLLEEPLIRTPYELLRRAHRSAQRQVEKDFVNVQTQLSNLLKSLGNDREADRALALQKVEAATERVRGLKRKLDDLQPSASAPSTLRERLAHVEGALLGPARREAEKAREEALAAVSRVAEERDRADAGSESEEEAEDDDDEEGEGEEGEEEEREGEERKVTEHDRQRRKSRVDEDAEMADVPLVKKKTATASAVVDGPDVLDFTLDRYIADHLLRSGRMKAAKMLAQSQDIENLVDIKLFAELSKIETALVEKHSTAEALAWCGENRGTLKKMNSNLEFTLRLQEFIELCRRRDTAGAITYARKNLAPWGSSHMRELQQGMTMLVFGETTGVMEYRNLYSARRWASVQRQFRETFLTVYALPSQSLLALALSAGLSSLRLPACAGTSPPPSPTLATGPLTLDRPLLPTAPDLHAILGLDSIETPKEEEAKPADPPAGNVDCPTCQEDVRVLAREVPMAHHVNSTLVCRISGDVMDSENVPLAFPNGCVYSSKALEEMSKNNFDVVTCPRTGETCAFSRLRKVYIS